MFPLPKACIKLSRHHPEEYQNAESHKNTMIVTVASLPDSHPLMPSFRMTSWFRPTLPSHTSRGRWHIKSSTHRDLGRRVCVLGCQDKEQGAYSQHISLLGSPQLSSSSSAAAIRHCDPAKHALSGRASCKHIRPHGTHTQPAVSEVLEWILVVCPFTADQTTVQCISLWMSSTGKVQNYLYILNQTQRKGQVAATVGQDVRQNTGSTCQAVKTKGSNSSSEPSSQADPKTDTALIRFLYLRLSFKKPVQQK